MKDKETVRLNFEFPREEYPYLKLLCAQKKLSFKALATALILKAIEEYEDEELAKQANERLADMGESDTISWDDAMKEAGWDDADNV